MRGKYEKKKVFCVGGCSLILRFFFFSLDIPHKISFITFFFWPSSPFFGKTRSYEKNFPQNFVSFLASSCALCSKFVINLYRRFQRTETGGDKKVFP